LMTMTRSGGGGRVAGRRPGAGLGCCWRYEPGLRLPRPVLRLRLYNAALEEYGEIPLQVDTGYEGPIMLPRETTSSS